MAFDDWAAQDSSETMSESLGRESAFEGFGAESGFELLAPASAGFEGGGVGIAVKED